MRPLLIVAFLLAVLAVRAGPDTPAPHALRQSSCANPSTGSCRVSRPSAPGESPGGKETIFICTENNLRKHIQRLNRVGYGNIFFRCPRKTTIQLTQGLRLKPEWKARGGGKYALVNLGKELILSGRQVGEKNGVDSILFLGNKVSAKIFGISFQDGRSRQGGAAIHAVQRTTLSLVNCSFRNNRVDSSKAIGGGGAVFSMLGSLSVFGSTFVGNSAATGGAIGASSSNLFIYNSRFRKNLAYSGYDDSRPGGLLLASGGAVRVDLVRRYAPEPVTVCGCQFYNNKNVIAPRAGMRPSIRPQYHGAAITVYNVAERLPSSGVSMKISRSSFYDHQGVDTVVYAHHAGDVLVENSVFVDNSVRRSSLETLFETKAKAKLVNVAFQQSSTGKRAKGYENAKYGSCELDNVCSNGVKQFCSVSRGRFKSAGGRKIQTRQQPRQKSRARRRS